MPDELATVRARLATQHVEQAEGGFCETCGSLWDWPCAVRALLEAYAAQAPIVAAAAAFIADSEAQGGPPLEACTACYWRLRGAVRAGVAGEGQADG